MAATEVSARYELTTLADWELKKLRTELKKELAADEPIDDDLRRQAVLDLGTVEGELSSREREREAFRGTSPARPFPNVPAYHYHAATDEADLIRSYAPESALELLPWRGFGPPPYELLERVLHALKRREHPLSGVNRHVR